MPRKMRRHGVNNGYRAPLSCSRLLVVPCRLPVGVMRRHKPPALPPQLPACAAAHRLKVGCHALCGSTVAKSEQRRIPCLLHLPRSRGRPCAFFLHLPPGFPSLHGSPLSASAARPIPESCLHKTAPRDPPQQQMALPLAALSLLACLVFLSAPAAARRPKALDARRLQLASQAPPAAAGSPAAATAATGYGGCACFDAAPPGGSPPTAPACATPAPGEKALESAAH